MSLVRLQDISIAFGATPILEEVSFTVENSDRCALVGRNGEGKSTLLKIIAGLIQPDNGELVLQNGVQVAYLSQSVPDHTGTIYEVVAGGLGLIGSLLADFYRETQSTSTDADGERLGRIQARIDAADAWGQMPAVEQIISRMSLDPAQAVQTLSGGMKRRVELARALVSAPDVLLLDEPTNHLDIGAIDWLTETLRGLSCAQLIVTHDRHFLDALARSILEIDRGRLTQWPGNYSAYRKNKQAALEVEAEQNALFDKKLAQEEAWIRQGIKARRTRNEGRVRALKKLRAEHAARREQLGRSRMTANQAEASGKIVFEARKLSYVAGDTPIVNQLSTIILRGDRLGIIGPNGCGKSTLVKLLLNELQPTAGEVVTGTQCQVAYYDQLRGQLDNSLSAADNVSGGRDTVQVNGQSRHIMSYMQDFLFAPARARAPITALSGGETGRLMLARLFLQPSNLLILDEPSNDLDIETLELLEALLSEYQGTVILISHDRELLENVITRSLVYQGNGRFVDVAGGYGDFERELAVSSTLKPVFAQSTSATAGAAAKRSDRSDVSTGSASMASAHSASVANTAKKTRRPAGSVSRSGSEKPKKLSYKQELELAALPEKISELESELAELQQLMSQSDLYKDRTRADAVVADADMLQKSLDEAYKRWEELEAIKDAGER